MNHDEYMDYDGILWWMSGGSTVDQCGANALVAI